VNAERASVEQADPSARSGTWFLPHLSHLLAGEPAVRVSIDQDGRLSTLLLQLAIDEGRAIW